MTADNATDVQYFGIRLRSVEKLLHSSSGGAFTFLYEEFLRRNPDGMIAGAVYTPDFHGVEHVLSANPEVIDKMHGSKYVQSRKKDIFRQIRDVLDTGGAVFFSGAPCEVAGLKAFLGREYPRLWTMDYICKGACTPRALDEYMQFLEKKYRSPVISVNMRYKWEDMDYCTPPFFMCNFENGKKLLKEFFNTELGIAFDILQRPSCRNCPYRELHHPSDFTVGDFHGVKTDQESYHYLGTSIIAMNNRRGKQFWQESDKSGICFEKINFASAYRKNHTTNIFHPLRSKLLDNLLKENTVKAVWKTVGIKEKIKMLAPIKLLRKVTVWRRNRKEKWNQ